MQPENVRLNGPKRYSRMSLPVDDNLSQGSA